MIFVYILIAIAFTLMIVGAVIFCLTFKRLAKEILEDVLIVERMKAERRRKMKFFEALPHLMRGQKIRRADDDVVYFSMTIEGRSLSDEVDVPVILNQDEINADDWEVVE